MEDKVFETKKFKAYRLDFDPNEDHEDIGEWEVVNKKEEEVVILEFCEEDIDRAIFGVIRLLDWGKLFVKECNANELYDLLWTIKNHVGEQKVDETH